jgi:hypothetical protein
MPPTGAWGTVASPDTSLGQRTNGIGKEDNTVDNQEEIAKTYPVSKSVLVEGIRQHSRNSLNKAIYTDNFVNVEEELYDFLISQGWTPPTI